MNYERVAYMCPKCSLGHFFNNADEFSTKCPNCNVEMVLIEKKFVSSEDEERKAKQWQKAMSEPLVTCPYCKSVDTKKITNTSKALHTAVFGIFSMGRNAKQWHCNSCKSDF